MAILDDLKDFERLRQICGGLRFDPSSLERDFLALSFHLPKPALSVREPKLYAVEDEERAHLAAALAAFSSPLVPEAIDISGGFPGLPEHLLLFLSPNQLNADHSSRTRAYLRPLLEQIYSENRFLADFTLHEALSGTVVAKRGSLDLREAHLFPDRFTPGPYTLSVTLDTPAGTVRQFTDLDQRLRQFAKAPKASLLDPQKVTAATDLATGLRKRIGALSRYHVPKSREFTATTGSCIVQLPNATIFYLSAQRNAAVYFGQSPFTNPPSNLAVFDGNDQQHALAKLVEVGVYQPSPAVLTQRVADLDRIADTAARAGSAGHTAYLALRDALKGAVAYFAETRNPDLQKTYTLRQQPELLEFMVCPSSDDPVVHDLLPRLSWHTGLRTYHNTKSFLEKFSAAALEERRGMLNELSAHLAFNHQQNNEVNCWLYRTHRPFCESVGVTFTLP